MESASSLPLLLTLLPFLGSGFVPTTSMPGGLQVSAGLQPSTPLVETVRGLLLGTALSASPAFAVGCCVVIALVGCAWSTAFYERRSAR